jgi:DNA-directed RNA polymerase I subunit RPA2
MTSQMVTTVNPTTSLETLKRERLFRNPPKDKSAFPALLAAIEPHVNSFNAVTTEGGLLDFARKDIGVKAVFDGKDGVSGNKISREWSFRYLRRSIGS